MNMLAFFFSSRRRHTRWPRDWSSDVCSSDLPEFLDKKPMQGTGVVPELCRPFLQRTRRIQIEIGRASCRERELIRVNDEGEEKLKKAMNTLAMSARAYERMMKVCSHTADMSE